MGKLLRHQLEKNRNMILTGIILPIVIFFLIMGTMSRAYAVGMAAPLFVAIGFVTMGALYFALVITTIVTDYNMYFGEEGSFYSGLPFDAKSVVWARFWNYVIVFLLLYVSVIFIAVFALKILTNMVDDADLTMAIQEMRNLLSMNPKATAFVIFFGILSGIRFIGSLLFSISFGSEKPFRQLGFGGPVIIFFVQQFLIQAITGLLTVLIPYGLGVMANGQIGFGKIELFDTVSEQAYFPIMVLVISLITTIFFYYRTYISHKKKLSIS